MRPGVASPDTLSPVPAQRASARRTHRQSCRVPNSGLSLGHLASSSHKHSARGVSPSMATQQQAVQPRTVAEEAVTQLPQEAVFDQDDVATLLREALTWSALNGLLVGDAQGEAGGSVAGLGMVHAPVTLAPTPFPAEAFYKAYALAPHFNRLVDAVSQDSQFLRSTLASAAKSDSFTASLLEIYAKTEELTGPRRIRLGMHRSDYMLDTGGDSAPGQGPQGSSLLQVELNTIASSFPGLSSRVTALHRHLASRGGYAKAPGMEEWRMPPNPATASMAEALAVGWRCSRCDPRAVVLVVVQPGERNVYDQQWLVQELWERHAVRAVRRTLAEVQQRGELRGDSNELWIDGHQVSVVYYRAGYSPDDYPTQAEWDARLLLERSSAVSCPSISYHLAGAKKVQQRLAEPGCLERFVPDPAVAQEMRSCFAGLWSLEAPPAQGEREAGGLPPAVADALASPHKFVLKPQREGGGNNIYGEDVRTKLEELVAEGGAGEGLGAYILMQRILPPINKTLMMRRAAVSLVDSLSELGVYGTFVSVGSSEVLNKAAGHLLRTKTASSDEGGVATGYAVLDSPYLVS